MAAPTNLLELAQQRLATWTAEKTSAQTAVAAAQTVLATGLTALEAATLDFADQNDAISELRAELALIVTPADAAPLLVQLENAIVAQRAASAAMLLQQGVIDRARLTLDAERARLQRSDSAIATAQAAVVAEQAAHNKREAAKAAVTQPPLNALAARATSVLASATFNNANARIQADFPQALRDRSIARAAFALDDADRAATMRKDVENLVASHYTSSGSAADKIAAPARALAAAEAALYDYVARGVSRCDAAEATLARIGATTNPPLTAEQHADIDDAVSLPAREAAATAEDARDTAADAVDVAQAEYDLEYLEVFAEAGAQGVADALADSNSDLAKAKEGVDDASDALTDANNDYDAGMRDEMRAWRAAVPDSAWRDLADFDAASRTLDELKQNPATLSIAVTNAEAALLAASVAVDDEARRLQAYSQALDSSGGAAVSAVTLLERTRFSALRGDA